MSLYQRLINDRNTARKNGDAYLVTLLGTVLGEIQGSWSSKDILTRTPEPDDSLCYKTIKSFVTNLQSLIKARTKDEDQKDLEILTNYLPKMLSEEEVTQIVTKHLETYTPDQGNKIKFVMQFMQSNYSGLYDSKLVSQLAIKV